MDAKPCNLWRNKLNKHAINKKHSSSLRQCDLKSSILVPEWVNENSQFKVEEEKKVGGPGKANTKNQTF